jgi:hypothetical protein
MSMLAYVYVHVHVLLVFVRVHPRSSLSLYIVRVEDPPFVLCPCSFGYISYVLARSLPFLLHTYIHPMKIYHIPAP